jgi:hypothetical protein
MTYQRRGRHTGQVSAGSALAAALALGAGFLTVGGGAASATTTSTSASSTSTTSPSTTSTTLPPVSGSDCTAAVSGTVLGRSHWVASTNAPSSSSNSPGNALDGNLATRFSTNKDQVPGLYFQVDLGSAQSFDEIALSVPNSVTDYARGYQVQVSNDGTNWVTVANCSGTSASEIVSFPTQTARYVKVVLTASSSSYWWSIDELNLYASPPPSPTTTTATATATTLTASPDPATIGQPVTFTAQVTPRPGSGEISFFAEGAPVPGCQDIALATATGEATCTTSYMSSLHVGVEALYSGGESFAPSASAVYDETINLPAAGYWLATGDGQVYNFGAAPALGSMTTSASTGPVVGLAATPSGAGYWMVTANGTVSAFGDAKYYGDLPGLGKKVSDIVAIAATTDGQGYYLVGADGGFFTFGDAKFHGSLPGIHLRVKDVVGMVASPSGAGYLLVGADGGVFSFGTSQFFGSLPGIGVHVHDIKAILPASNGTGYILVGADGGAFTFGTGVKFHGSVPGEGIKINDIVGIALTPDDGGYYMAGADGHVFAFGDAQAQADPAALASHLPVAAIAST